MIKVLKNNYKKLKFLIYIFIPIIVVIICRTLKIAQGEANEEIVIGIMLLSILNISKLNDII